MGIKTPRNTDRINSMKSLNQIICLLLLLGCGGGDNSSSNIIVPLPVHSIPAPNLFDQTPIRLFDAVSSYSHACHDPSFQFLLPTKINNDRYIDFIAHYWCDSITPSSFNDQPTKDALVAYVSDGIGGYVIDNFGVFGEAQAKLGGASRKFSRGDLNGDLKDDFAFAMNWEDGRAAYDFDSVITNYARPAILLSSDSGYEVVHIGNPDWGHSVQIKENKVMFGGHSSQAFEFTDSGWVDISNEYSNLSFASFLTYDDYIVNSVRKNGSQGLELLKNNNVLSSVIIQESFKVNFETWNNSGTGNYNELGVYNIRGKNYFDGMVSEMCRLDNFIVATINASKLISGEEIIEGAFYSEIETTPVVIFAFYEVTDEALVEKNIKMVGEEIDHNFNFFDCNDVNNDGRKDIVAQVFSQQWNNYDNNKGVPEIYISNNNGFYNLDTSAWPTYSFDVDSQGYLYDVDSDGHHDLVVFPLKIDISDDVEIYIANRNITN